MDAGLRAFLAVPLLAALPALAQAQGGKIDEVERDARNSGARSDDHEDGGGGGGVFGVILRGLIHGNAVASHHPDTTPATQTYGRYPWGGPRLDEKFVTRGPDFRHAFGVTSVSIFRDASSTLGATSFDFEAGVEEGYVAFNATLYREPKQNETDHLASLRAELGGLGQMGRGFFTGGLGGRIVCLDSDVCAYGADLGVGARVLPLKPFVVSGTARAGGMKWHDGGWFWVTETNASLSVLAGRFEVAGGWHWLKLGSATAFAGPIMTVRVWF